MNANLQVNSVTDLEFDMPLPKAKNEKVSRKRKDQQPVVSVPEHSVPESGPSSTDIIDTNVAQKEERHITWSDMPPPAAKSKKPRIQSSSSSSSKHAIPEGKTIENPFPLEPERAARPPRNDQVGDRGKGKLTGPPSSSSSSNLLNTSVSVS